MKIGYRGRTWYRIKHDVVQEGQTRCVMAACTQTKASFEWKENRGRTKYFSTDLPLHSDGHCRKKTSPRESCTRNKAWYFWVVRRRDDPVTRGVMMSCSKTDIDYTTRRRSVVKKCVTARCKRLEFHIHIAMNDGAEVEWCLGGRRLEESVCFLYRDTQRV